MLSTSSRLGRIEEATRLAVGLAGALERAGHDAPSHAALVGA
jgi:hypothetical protein